MGRLAEEFFAVAGAEEEREPEQVGAEGVGVVGGVADEGGEAVGAVLGSLVISFPVVPARGVA